MKCHLKSKHSCTNHGDESGSESISESDNHEETETVENTAMTNGSIETVDDAGNHEETETVEKAATTNGSNETVDDARTSQGTSMQNENDASESRIRKKNSASQIFSIENRPKRLKT